jgi:hypothetical protein
MSARASDALPPGTRICPAMLSDLSRKLDAQSAAFGHGVVITLGHRSARSRGWLNGSWSCNGSGGMRRPPRDRHRRHPRATRLRDLLASVCPGLERIVDGTSKTGLHLLTRYVTPAEIRAAWPGNAADESAQVRARQGHPLYTLADAALAAAQAQQIRMLGEAVAAGLIRDIAAGPPARERLSARQAHRGGPGPPP